MTFKIRGRKIRNLETMRKKLCDFQNQRERDEKIGNNEKNI